MAAMENVAMLRTRVVKPHHIHLVSDPIIEMLNMPCERGVNETKQHQPQEVSLRKLE
jgi:hypothetical protein